MGNIIGENVRRIRKEKGITQDVLAKRLGNAWNKQNICRLEKTNIRPRLDTIEHLASALDVSISNLIGEQISDKVFVVLPVIRGCLETEVTEAFRKESDADAHKIKILSELGISKSELESGEVDLYILELNIK